MNKQEQVGVSEANGFQEKSRKYLNKFSDKYYCYLHLDDSKEIDFQKAVNSGQGFNGDRDASSWNKEFFAYAVYFAKKEKFAESEKLLDLATTYIEYFYSCKLPEFDDCASLYIFIDKPEKIKNNGIIVDYNINDLAFFINESKEMDKPVDFFKKILDSKIDSFFENVNNLNNSIHELGISTNLEDQQLEIVYQNLSRQVTFENLFILINQIKNGNCREQDEQRLDFLVSILERKGDNLSLYYRQHIEILEKICSLKEELGYDTEREERKMADDIERFQSW